MPKRSRRALFAGLRARPLLLEFFASLPAIGLIPSVEIKLSAGVVIPVLNRGGILALHPDPQS